jgi:ribosomal protein S18 acetylase RimI-like enzyme
MSAYAKIYTPDTSAAVGWRRLTWDSDLFGLSAARLEDPVDSARLAAILDDCRQAGIQHLVARVDIADLSTIHALEGAGFELLDGIQTFTLNPSEACFPVASELTARQYRKTDRPQVLAIARTAFVHDRFHADTALKPGVANRVHEVWVDNCCAGRMADAVFVAEDQGAILGFVTVKLDPTRGIAVIGMVATLDAARRRGVARAITMLALRWIGDRGAGSVQVGTQLANIAAARLYSSFGFRPVSVALTFRKVL